MQSFLDKFDAGALIGFTAVVGGLLVAITSVVSVQWRRVRIAEMEATLKQQMLDKGMSAAEIDQVMKASPESGLGAISSTGNEALDKAALAQRMVDNGYEGEDIERVLKAYEQPAKKADKPVANNA